VAWARSTRPNKRAHAATLRSRSSRRRSVGKNYLASVYRDQRRDAEAERLLVDVLDTRRRVQGAEHPDTANTLVALALLRLDQGRSGDAESLAREAAHGYERIWPDNWRRYGAESVLGSALADQKRFTEAEPLLLSGYNGLVEREATIPAPDRPAIQRARDRITRFYQESDHPGKAKDWQAGLGKKPE